MVCVCNCIVVGVEELAENPEVPHPLVVVRGVGWLVFMTFVKGLFEFRVHYIYEISIMLHNF
jgi:hypothetical protein